MRIISPILLGLSLAAAGSTLTAAQTTPSMPKVIQVFREYIKPGRSGAIHDHSESNFVQAMAREKWPTHYVALNSLSGKSRALYMTAYDSFDAWQKDADAMNKNAALSGAFDLASMTDGELLDSTDAGILSYDDDLSYRPQPDLSFVRYFEISTYRIKPGHRKDWHDLVNMVIDAHKKAGTSASWATYSLAYGGDGDTYIIFSADKSMADIDQGYMEDKKFRDAMGEDGMKRFQELVAETIEHADNGLLRDQPPPELSARRMGQSKSRFLEAQAGTYVHGPGYFGWAMNGSWELAEKVHQRENFVLRDFSPIDPAGLNVRAEQAAEKLAAL